MVSKRNAALEALEGAGFKPTSETSTPAPVMPIDTIVPPRSAKPSKGVAKVMVYMPAKVARKFKEIAFTEDRKANDVYLEALDMYLAKNGHGGLKGVTER
jgi:hypothetical protein